MIKLLKTNFELSKVLKLIFYVWVFFITANLARFTFYKNGNEWIHGGWLINSNVETVRRGDFGTVMLWIADLFHFNPVYMVGIMHFALFVLLAYAINDTLLKNKQLSNALWPLILSPAFFIFFWINATSGLRKEIFTFTALATLALAIKKNKNELIVLATIIECIGIIGHEFNLLFSPIFGLGLFLVCQPRQIKTLILMLLLVALSSLYSIFNGVFSMAPENIAPLCNELLIRNIPEHLCGPLDWLNKDSAHAANGVFNMLTSRPIDAMITLIVYFSSIYFGVIRSKILHSKYATLGFILTLLLSLPLFFVAQDYGRIIYIQFSTFTLIALILSYKHVDLVKTPEFKKFDFSALIALNTFFPLSIMIGASDRRLLAILILMSMSYFIYQAITRLKSRFYN